MAERRRVGGDQSAGTGEPPHDVAGILADRIESDRGVPQRDHLGRVRGEGEPLREPPPEPRLQEGRQGRHPADELPGVAADLLRRAAGGLPGRAAQLPLHGGRDQVLPRTRGRGRACVRSGVHGPRRADRRPRAARAHALLRGRRLPLLRGAVSRPRVLLLVPHARHPPRGRRRRGHLLQLRHDGLPQGHRAAAPLPHARLPRGTEPPRPDEGRLLPLHPAPLPHGREDALVRQLPRRRARRSPQGREARMDHPLRERGEVYDRVAARPVGAGHPRCDRARRGEAGGLPPRPVAAHAHRRAAGAARAHPALEEGLSAPRLRHELRPLRIDGAGRRPPRRREHRPRGRHRRRGLRLADEDHPPGRQRGCARRGRRARAQGPRRDEVLLQEPGGDGGDPLGRRLAPDGRHGRGARWLHLPRGPREGRDHHGRREPLPRPDRGLPAGASGDQGRRRHRPRGRASRRDRGGDHRGQGGHVAHGGRGEPLLPRPAALQAPAQDHLRARAAQPHRQDREAAASLVAQQNGL